MKKRRRRIGEVVCNCRAYPFPHRMMGGKCKGYSKVVEFFEDQASAECRTCRYCFLDSGFECEVVNGTERTHECPHLSEFLDRNEVPVPKKLGRKRWQ